MRRLIRRLRDDERGAYMAVVGALFFTLLVLMVLAVDTGMVYQERHELQNAADAGALAIAFDCARGGSCNETDGAALAKSLADANAITDGIADVHDVDDPDGVDIDTAAGTVTVTTRSEAQDGTFSLYLMAAKIFGMEATTVRARATATIYIVGGATTLPITMCSDVWDFLTSDGANLPSGQVYVKYDTSGGQHTDPEEECDEYPGGFGFLSADSDCTVSPNADGTYPGTPGNTLDQSGDCESEQLLSMLREIIDNEETVLIPVFEPPGIGSGENGSYNVIGFAAFNLDGFFLDIAGVPANKRRYKVTNTECNQPVSCLRGEFIEFVPLEAMGSNDSEWFGTKTVRLSG